MFPLNAMLEGLNAIAPGEKHKRPISPYNKCIPVNARGNAVADKVKVAHWLAEN